MINSNTRLWQMVDFMKGNHFPWNCRAGQNSMIIRVDGTLAPCFPKFETKQLDHQNFFKQLAHGFQEMSGQM